MVLVPVTRPLKVLGKRPVLKNIPAVAHCPWLEIHCLETSLPLQAII
jgi:hypothetical protein